MKHLPWSPAGLHACRFDMNKAEGDGDGHSDHHQIPQSLQDAFGRKKLVSRVQKASSPEGHGPAVRPSSQC